MTEPPKAETIRFAVTDVEGVEQLQREYGAFVEELEKATGLEVEFTPVNNRTAAVEAMRAEQVDFVLTGPAEYVVFEKLTDAKPVVGWHRPDYFAQIVVMAEGDIKSLADLKGKKVAFGEVGSTSQQLGPAQVLADAGLKYNVDYTAEIIKRNVAVEAMIRGDVAGCRHEPHASALGARESSRPRSSPWWAGSRPAERHPHRGVLCEARDRRDGPQGLPREGHRTDERRSQGRRHQEV